MTLTFGSLFAGIGGIDLGFERAGMECQWQVEIDDYANRILAKHWPDARRWGDIRTFPPEPVADWRVDLICGGFPCQDISYAGKGAGLSGERSGLFYEAMRVVRVLEPRIIVLENVAALLTRGLDAVLGTLASLGFDAEWHCIPAAAVGAPHRRDRCFLLAYSDARRVHAATERRPSKEVGDGRDDTERWGQRAIQFAGASHTRRTTYDVADTERQYVEGAELQRQRVVFEQSSGDDGWWSVEPSVGRMADGIPFELVCLGRGVNDDYEGDDAEKDATRVWTYRGWRLLRCMWENRSLASASPRLYQDRLLASVPEVPRGSAYKGWYVGPRIEKDEGLRDMWQNFYAKSQQETQDVLPRMLERIRQEKRPQALASRVDRLRCLGNAVVPQVAEWIGRAIVESDK